MKDNLDKMVEVIHWMSETTKKIYYHTDEFIIKFEPNRGYEDIDDILFNGDKINITYLTEQSTVRTKRYLLIDVVHWLEELN